MKFDRIDVGNDVLSTTILNQEGQVKKRIEIENMRKGFRCLATHVKKGVQRIGVHAHF